MEFRLPAYLLILSVITFVAAKAASPPVSLVVNGLLATLDNGLIKISFTRSAVASSLFKNGKNLIANTEISFYFDWTYHRNHRFSPSHLDVIFNSTQRAHIMYSRDIDGFLSLEYHIIMEQGRSGLYSYVKAANKNKIAVRLEEMRLVYVFNPKIMNQISNQAEEGTPPLPSKLKYLPMIQDATWKLSNGTVYSKYDYAGYIRDTTYQGVFGNGFGAWMISPSREYHSGGPLKQDLLVHQGPLIANYMVGRHFGTPVLVAPPGWSKIYGPWMLHFNEGTNEELKTDVILQSKVEQSLWPYKWMNETDYPLNRGTLIGKVDSPVQCMVILTSSLEELFDLQTLGFSYSIETNKTGDFQLENIRPGTYKLTAYPIEGYGIGYQTEKLITIVEGENKASLELMVPTEVIWAIGETNRRSDIYFHSNDRRNYILHTLPLAELEFEIGKSKYNTDWYYAQTKPGTWSIKYKDTPDGKNRKLQIGLASTSYNVVLAVFVNDHQMNKFEFENDQAIYRSATQSGNFHAETITIPANLVATGDNVIKLTLISGYVMYDSINLSAY